MIRILEALFFAGAVALSRLLPHPPNTTLTGSIALYTRKHFGIYGFLVPFAGLFISDVIIGFYDWRLLISVYASFGLYFVLGQFLSPMSRVETIAFTGIAASTLFFLITNTVVWALSSWYPHNITGLFACLAAGLPFYRNMLCADVLGALCLFKMKSISSFILGQQTSRVVTTQCA